MQKHLNKDQTNPGRAVANSFSTPKTGSGAAAQRKHKEPAPVQKVAAPEEDELVQKKAGPEEEEGLLQGKFEPVQRVENNTGLPDNLKTGVESLSGVDLSDVRVHRNSSHPAQLNALAYAQGSNIHVAAGQDKHLAHEAWHVAQQKQGRVKPTTSFKGQNINNDPGLEKEADVMGEKAGK